MIAGHILNSHDRAGKATTSVSKSGTGTWTLSRTTWTLSRTNSYTGPTTVAGGVLACAKPAALGNGLLDISSGARLQLHYSGARQIAALTLDGAAQAPGTCGSTTSPAVDQSDTSFSGPSTVTAAP